MPKKKKTRQQKILAEKRRETSTMPLYTITPESLPQQAKPAISSMKQTAAVSTNSYTYLASDLGKTTLFTLAIVLIELALRFFTK